MDPSQTIEKLRTAKECATFARNAEKLSRPDLAAMARRRALDLRASQYAASSEVERECIQAVLAYEDARSRINGKRTSASRTWPMIERHGVISAVEKIVLRAADTLGYSTLVEMGLGDYAFEAVVLRHPTSFSDAAVAASRQRQLSQGS